MPAPIIRPLKSCHTRRGHPQLRESVGRRWVDQSTWDVAFHRTNEHLHTACCRKIVTFHCRLFGSAEDNFPFGHSHQCAERRNIGFRFLQDDTTHRPFSYAMGEVVVAAAAPGTACNPVGSAPDLSNDTVHFRNLAGSGSVPISMKLHPCPMGRLVLRVVVRGDARGCLGTFSLV